MKLIRWVEVHIGRSRRKGKKDKENLADGQSRRKDESTPSTPLHKVEPLGKDLPRSAGSTPHRVKHPPSPHPLLRAPETPSIGGRLHIRTSFLDPGLSPLPPTHQPFGSSTTLDSPRVRCRIRTNPWLPSPKNSGSRENGWTTGNPGIRSSSIGSESSESIPGSGFGSQSSGSLWEGFPGDPWGQGFRSSGRSPSTGRLPRVTLERPGHRSRPEVERLSFYDEDTPYCPVTYCRPIPRSAWINFRDLTTDLLEKTTVQHTDDGESSDEAYSEDYVHVEDQDDISLRVMQASKNSPPDTGSPQADSACGSDRDNSSCSTTPLSETPASSSSVPRKSLLESKELLQDKVLRLRRERYMVDQRMQEARAEEILRREEQLLLQRELVQFRRLLLLQTLSELRTQLEKQGKRRQRIYGAQPEMVDKAGHDDEEETWLQVQTELLG